MHPCAVEFNNNGDDDDAFIKCVYGQLGQLRGASKPAKPKCHTNEMYMVHNRSIKKVNKLNLKRQRNQM